MVDSTWTHITVLLHEAVQALQVQPQGTYVDATFGRGGHSRLILSQLGPQGRLIVFDKDPEAIAQALGNKEVHPHAMNALNIPGCTYCHPQIASVGLTEAKAKDAGYKVRVGKFPFIGNGKAIAMGEPEGFVKTVFDAKTGALLGAHMVGPEVTEMIQGYGIARTLETTEAELMHTVFPHPTVSEAMHESVLDAYGRVIHI